MPCRDDWPDSNPEHIIREDNKKIRDKVDRLTAMLCSLCQWVDDNCGNQIDQLGKATDKELPKWWIEHKKFDEKRKAKIRLQALAKLTAEEQEALGIKG